MTPRVGTSLATTSLLRILLLGCDSALLTAHNEIVEIESAWVDAHNRAGTVHDEVVDCESRFIDEYNAAIDRDGQYVAVKSAIENASTIDTAPMDQYGETFGRFIENLKAWERGLLTGDDDSVEEALTRSAAITGELNELARKEQAKAAQTAIERIMALELESVPQDYRDGVARWRENMQAIVETVEADNVDEVNKLVNNNVPLVKALNEIASEHGLVDLDS